MSGGFHQTIAAIFSLSLFALGLSYVLHAKHWARLYEDFDRNPEEFITTGLLIFTVGLFVATGFNDWSSTWPAFITIFGWLMVIEATALSLNPSLVGWIIRRVGTRQEMFLRLGGVVLLVLGGLLIREYLF